jgi:hypothetical protein
MEPTFSVDEFYARRVDPRWEVLKEKGNVLFKRGAFEASIVIYTQALHITFGSAKSMPALFCTLKTHRRGSPGRRIADEAFIYVHMSRFLAPPLMQRQYTMPNGEIAVVREPNQPAAVCYSNRSAAYMKLAGDDGSPQSMEYLSRALKDARLACRHCPNYAKGHFRVFQALQSLGRHSAANKKKSQLALYEHYVTRMPWPAIASLTMGWISLAEYQFIYSTVRFQEILRRLKSSPPDTFMCQASLVPFLGGQFLVIGVTYLSPDWKKVSINALYFVCSDECGSEDLERKPLPIASKQSVQVTKDTLIECLKAFAKQGL